MKCCKWKYCGLVPLLIGVFVVLPGCSAAQKMTPHMGFGGLNIEADVERDDIIVMGRVEGSSTLDVYLFGAVQIIDGDKLQLFGIKFFKDKYTYFKGIAPWATTIDRAYYKALEAHPDADAVFHKSWDREEAGIPLLWHNVSVTVKGKAVQLKADP